MYNLNIVDHIVTYLLLLALAPTFTSQACNFLWQLHVTLVIANQHINIAAQGYHCKYRKKPWYKTLRRVSQNFNKRTSLHTVNRLFDSGATFLASKIPRTPLCTCRRRHALYLRSSSTKPRNIKSKEKCRLAVEMWRQNRKYPQVRTSPECQQTSTKYMYLYNKALKHMIPVPRVSISQKGMLQRTTRNKNRIPPLPATHYRIDITHKSKGSKQTRPAVMNDNRSE
jgi:hypothetical protein